MSTLRKKATPVDARPEVNDPREKTNDDIIAQEERWNAWRRKQAKRRGELAVAKPRAKK